MGERQDSATFRFYADLNDFLPSAWQQQAFVYPVYDGRQSIKHLIEAIGVPHTEVELLLVNGRSINFHYLVQANDSISVYPPFATIDVAPLVQVRPSLSRPYRFVLDNHLGKLTRYLRLLGLDALYFNDTADDAELAQIAYDENRILLTRDRGLLKRSNVIYGYCLRTRDSEKQLTAVLHRFQLHDQIAAWTRCLRCNGLLEPVAKGTILHRLEPKTKLYFDEFQICRDCQQIYWQGSHTARLQELINRTSNFDSARKQSADDDAFPDPPDLQPK